MFPNRLSDRLVLCLWSILWHLALPLIILYLWYRSRSESLYITNLRERFGGGSPIPPDTIWVHAVSLGETRAADPLIRSLIDRGETILLTTITAAGRAEASKLFADDIAAKRLYLRWTPIELPWALRRFICNHKPRFGMIMEIELWPQMIAQAKRLGVPLIMAQAQYPDKSFARDQKGFGRIRARSIQGFDLILAKSQRHAERFCHFGAKNVRVTGELRFEQTIPQTQLDAADALLETIDPKRLRICLASTAPDEDPMLIPVIQELLKHTIGPKPFIIYVPRHPKNFEETKQKLRNAGLNMAVRSRDFAADLSLLTPLPADCDGLFGDSLGEINFYYALAQSVFVGDSFNGEGSHNIIEPLRLLNSVVVGPSIWGIEYPGLEAIEDGVLIKLATPDDLLTHWRNFTPNVNNDQISNFIHNHGGATTRILKELSEHYLPSTQFQSH